MHGYRAMSAPTASPSARRAIVVLVLVLIAVAAFVRIWQLELRPPHHDEGVNGWFAERVAKDGYYVYDPANYHGPTFFYLLAAARKVLGFGLWQLRLPAALIGLAACFLPLLLRRRIGLPAALAACAVLATSPTLVYYARYAIHETLLAGLGLLATACTLRWADRSSARWLFGAGAAIAGMVATKETTVLFIAAGMLWFAGEVAAETLRARSLVIFGRRGAASLRGLAAIGAVLATMVVIHVVMYTGAFRVPGRIGEQLWRSVQAYLLWQKTGIDESGHIKSVWYYVHLGLRYEAVLYGLALVGTVTRFRERAIRGPAIVGFAMLGLYSAIPYKMPWLPTSWLMLLAIPAGAGAVVLVRLARRWLGRMAVVVVVTTTLVPALAITWRSSFVDPADVSEDLAYVHTSTDYNEWFGYVQLAARLEGTRNVRIAIDSDVVWPLPWAMTPYRNARWQALGDEHVIIAAQSRAIAVESRLAARYLRRTYRFRDSAEPVVVYLRQKTFAPVLDAAQVAGMTVVQPRRQ